MNLIRRIKIIYYQSLFDAKLWISSFPSRMFLSKGKKVIAMMEIEKALRERGIEPNDAAFRNPDNIWTIGSTANKVYRIT